MKLGPFEEVILENSSVDELKEKVCVCLFVLYTVVENHSIVNAPSFLFLAR